MSHTTERRFVFIRLSLHQTDAQVRQQVPVSSSATQQRIQMASETVQDRNQPRRTWHGVVRWCYSIKEKYWLRMLLRLPG